MDSDRNTLTITGRGQGTKNHESLVIAMTDALQSLLLRLRLNPAPADPISSVHDAKKCLATACRRLGYSHFTHHDFRHFFATTCIESGVDIPIVSRWLGHKDGGALAMRVYGQLRDDAIVAWDIFSEKLWRFNLASQFNLLAVFSCCDGLHQIDALSTDKPCPFATLVGCEGKLSTQELLNGFQCFYAELMASGQAHRALTALQAQIVQSTAKFRFFSAEYAFLRVASRVLSDNANPMTFEREARFVRAFVQKLFARRGIRQSVSLRDAQDAVRASQRITLPQFFETFFAVDKIPGNRARFNYEKLRALAESRTSA